MTSPLPATPLSGAAAEAAGIPVGAARVAAFAAAPRRSIGWGEVYAALDLGTNNCRLLVARASESGFRVIDAFSRIVRLGEGVSASGLLSEAAMQRTLDALKVCAAKITHRGVTRARYVATEACRRAGNCGGGLDEVPARLGQGRGISTHSQWVGLVAASFIARATTRKAFS